VSLCCEIFCGDKRPTKRVCRFYPRRPTSLPRGPLLWYSLACQSRKFLRCVGFARRCRPTSATGRASGTPAEILITLWLPIFLSAGNGHKKADIAAGKSRYRPGRDHWPRAEEPLSHPRCINVGGPPGPKTRTLNFIDLNVSSRLSLIHPL
jgi:hypothetical protein